MPKAVIDPFFEAMMYLGNRANGTSAARKCEELIEKMPIYRDELEKIFLPIIQLEDLLDRRITIDEDRLHFFFDSLFVDTTEKQYNKRRYHDTIASLFVSHLELYVLGIDELFEELRKQDMKTRVRFFVIPFWPEGTYINVNNKLNIEDLLNLIKSSKLDERVKWRVIDALLSYDEYLEELYQMLKPIVAFIESKQNVCENMLYKFFTENPEMLIFQKEEALNASELEAFNKIQNALYSTKLYEEYDDFSRVFVQLRISILGFDVVSFCLHADGTPVEKREITLSIGVLQSKLKTYENMRFEIDSLVPQLKAISDTLRIKILLALKEKSAYSQEISEMVSIPPTTLSHHISKLTMAGFLKLDCRAGKIYYSTNLQKLDEFIGNLRYEFSK